MEKLGLKLVEIEALSQFWGALEKPQKNYSIKHCLYSLIVIVYLNFCILFLFFLSFILFFLYFLDNKKAHDHGHMMYHIT